ncbi:hypothetical protein DFJ63DRAFT_317024 [Scheffersomyces coipomensis]|uniref:uncharacterized protein n=1 Tax=Scheffersomyces coipomensis TaxID=1788519 RepID=UPI00315DD012
MGQQKLWWGLIENLCKRSATFKKRLEGFFRKAIQLTVYTGAEVAVIVINDNEVHYFSSHGMEHTLEQYFANRSNQSETISQRVYQELINENTETGQVEEQIGEQIEEQIEELEEHIEEIVVQGSSSNNQNIYFDDLFRLVRFLNIQLDDEIMIYDEFQDDDVNARIIQLINGEINPTINDDENLEYELENYYRGEPLIIQENTPPSAYDNNTPPPEYVNNNPAQDQLEDLLDFMDDDDDVYD